MKQCRTHQNRRLVRTAAYNTSTIPLRGSAAARAAAGGWKRTPIAACAALCNATREGWATTPTTVQPVAAAEDWGPGKHNQQRHAIVELAPRKLCLNRACRSYTVACRHL